MQEFTAKHRDEIRGVLSGFDRLVFTERYLDALAEVDDDTAPRKSFIRRLGQRRQSSGEPPSRCRWSTVTLHCTVTFNATLCVRVAEPDVTVPVTVSE